MKLPVIEIFGPTIQGEGAVIGKKTVFIRTAGCDYQCSWCDSAFTWDGSGKDEIRLMTTDEVLEKLNKIGFQNFEHVTISGGNPALLNLDELIKQLKEKSLKVGLETQGSVWQEWLDQIDDLTISPKPPSSGIETDFVCLEATITRLKERIGNGHVSLKVVIFDDTDLKYAKKIHGQFTDVPFYLQVGNTDLGTNNNSELALLLLEKLDWLVTQVVSDPEWNKVRVLPQLHTLLWGNKKGV